MFSSGDQTLNTHFISVCAADWLLIKGASESEQDERIEKKKRETEQGRTEDWACAVS